MSKKLLYVIGENELAEHKDILIDSLQERINILRQNSDRLNVDIAIFPEDRSQWFNVNKELAERLFDMIEEECKRENTEEVQLDIRDFNAEGYDAYYGSPSPYVMKFTENKKPVMIADYEIMYD